MANPFASVLPAMRVQASAEPADGNATRTSNLSVGSKIPSYAKGVRRVPKTGLAKLEKGEAVLNVKQAKRYRRGKVGGAASALGAGKKKVPTKDQKILRAAGHEMKVSPPKILKQTRRKSGAAQAEKQRVAILLSKARAAGADIPEKG